MTPQPDPSMEVSTPDSARSLRTGPNGVFRRLWRWGGRVLRANDGPMTGELRQRPDPSGLGHLPDRLLPDTTHRAICGFCSTGCQLDIHIREGISVNLSPSETYPVNSGMACPKGWEALTPLKAPDRGTTPLLKNPRTGRMEPVSWSEAAQIFCERFGEIARKHGPDTSAFISTGQLVTEEMAFLGAFAKFGMGMVHGDGNTRQCMATAVAAYKQSFGFDAPPFSYSDFENSDVMLFVGANPCIAHPILWQRVLNNRRSPKILVLDPRRTETASQATWHGALRPKSDLVLLYGIAHVLIQEGWVDTDFVARHTTGFDSFREFVRVFTPETVAARSGLEPSEILALARTLHEGQAVSFWWTMGVNQGHEATRTAQALINLALMTGNIGRPGTGANSITGQCNAMGSRLFSNTTNLLGGYDFTSEHDRAQIARALGIPAERIPNRPSWAYDQILEGMEDGTIRGLWCIATNPAHSWIHSSSFEERRKRLDFLVVQDMYCTTETARLADLYLPAAGWGEKDGTFINSERRIGRVRRVASPPGEAIPDFEIIRRLSDAWGVGSLFSEWTTPEAVFQILKRCSAGQPCDITGIRDFDHVESAGGIQWPWTEQDVATTGEPVQERRLFEDGCFYTPDNRARFVFGEPMTPPEEPDAEYPFVLLTGRGTSAQWHTNTRTAKSAVLRQLYPAGCYVELNPTDARALGIGAHALVQVRSRRGTLLATAFVTPTVQPGQAFIPMHYREVNRLTHPSFDGDSRQPNYKYCAVQVQRV